MKKLLAITLTVFLLFSFVFHVCADTSVDTAKLSEVNEVAAEEAGGNDTVLMKNLQIFMFVGAVVGALVLVAFMYKKKDETRHL